jgi:ATP-dependent DNA ligase
MPMSDMPLQPMLATELPAARLPHLQGEWLVQRKYDGDRVILLVYPDSTWRAWSRRGGEPRLTRQKSLWIDRFVAVLHGAAPGSGWLLDCEMLDDRLVVFQVIASSLYVGSRSAGPEAQDGTYDARTDDDPHRFVFWLSSLNQLAGGAPNCEVASAWTTTTPDLRVGILRAAESGGWEGIILRADGGYHPGRVDQLRKVKLVSDVDVVVSRTGVDGKNNCEMAVLHGKQPRVVGVVSTPSFVPDVGDVLTVRALYAGDNGHLIQPRIIRRRADKTPAECTFDQITPLIERRRAARA